VAPFEPGGVIVLADATSVIGLSRDRYVGSDVRRQLAGADIVLVTKTDVCEPGEIADVDRWLGAATGGAPSLDVVDGVVPADVVLGLRPDAVTSVADREDHADRYATWAWTSSDAIPLEAIRSMVASLPDHVLRVKGVVRLDDGSAAVVQVVGRRVDIDETVIVPDRSQLVAIGLRTDPPSPTLFGRH
jgi:G3E family GTPase